VAVATKPTFQKKKFEENLKSAILVGLLNGCGVTLWWLVVARSNTLDVLRPVLDALVNPKRGAVTLIRPEAGRQTDTQR
jgi:hypothetical protein